MPYTRREFLKTGAFLVSMGATAPAFLTRTAEMVEAASSASDRRIVVVVQLSGGNDGLNTVVPFNDPLYAANRPTLGLKASDVLPLTDQVGLNGVMTAMKTRYDLGQVAVIQNVGYPNPNRSHFRSMDIWHTGVPETIAESGWLGRYLDSCCSGTGGAVSQAQVDAWALGSSLPLSLWVEHVVVPTINTVASFKFTTDGEYPADSMNKLTAFRSIYAEQASPRAYDEFIRSVGLDALQTSDTLASVAKTYSTNVTFPATTLGKNLKTISQLIAADLGTRIFYTSFSGFDTHSNQITVQTNLLKTLSDGLDAFLADMEYRGRLDDVVILCFSEFGRRVKENASSGTDHGTAAPMFAVGKPVKGGLYGPPPDLTTLSQGDLIFQIDFRSVYATIIQDWLGGSIQQVLGGTFAPVPFLV